MKLTMNDYWDPASEDTDWLYDDEVDFERLCDCGRPANDVCGFCGNPLCHMCFECGAGFCHREHTQEQIDDYARALTGETDDDQPF